MTARIRREDAAGVRTLVIDRPDKLNALDMQAFEELNAELDALEAATDSIGCVVLRGAGRGFSAGADLNAVAARTVAFKPGVIDRLARLPQPTIAAIHGVCFTGGLELALACDLIMADATARFADTHGKWGLVGAWGMNQRLPRRIGAPAAKRMMMTAEPVSAEAALALGLVDEMAGAGGLDALLARLTGAIVANSWHTNMHAKRISRETEGMALGAALAWEQQHYPGYAPDHAERIARFAKPAIKGDGNGGDGNGGR